MPFVNKFLGDFKIMARQINSVILQGRLARDPDLRMAGEVSVGNFTLAVSRGKNKAGDEKADFISCKAFGKLASDIICKYAHKGDLVVVQGRIQTGDYTDKDGIKKYTTDVVVDEFSLCGGKKKDSNETAADNNSAAQGFEDMETAGDDDIPF